MIGRHPRESRILNRTAQRTAVYRQPNCLLPAGHVLARCAGPGGRAGRGRTAMAVAGNAEWRRRAELTGLLQTCRSRMARPVPQGNSTGLRQEDAADLAGLSVRRYAAFERGEIANPLPEMVETVAAALRMTAAEHSALHILATGHDPPLSPVPPGDGARAEVSPVFLELLARQDPNPAVITDETWTVIARNEAMSAWAGSWLDQAPAGQQNLVLYLFSEDCEALLPDVHAARRAII